MPAALSTPTHMESNPLADMRTRLLSMDAAELGLAPTEALPSVWGLIMETGYAQGPVTLLTIAEGSTSLYLPTGGGIIGAGEHRPVRAAGTALLETAEFALPHLGKVEGAGAPAEGVVQFLALTFGGVFAAQVVEQELGRGTGPLSALFFAGQALLSQVRIASPDS